MSAESAQSSPELLEVTFQAVAAQAEDGEAKRDLMKDENADTKYRQGKKQEGDAGRHGVAVLRQRCCCLLWVAVVAVARGQQMRLKEVVSSSPGSRDT